MSQEEFRASQENIKTTEERAIRVGMEVEKNLMLAEHVVLE